MAFSVIVPCYDEEPSEVRKTIAYMDGYFSHEPEFIVLENGSRKLDGCFGWTEARYFQRDERGLGWALREGIRKSSYDSVFFLPADMSYDLDFVPRALRELSDGVDIVIGSKALKGSEVDRPFTRKIISEAYGWYTTLVHGLAILDVTGTKGYKRCKVEPLLDSCNKNGIGFEIQLFKAAKKKGLQVKEIPVKVHDGRSLRFIS